MTKGIRRLLVAVTRDERREDPFSQELERLGLEPLHLPTIRIVDPSDFRPLEVALTNASRFDWVIFTSAHAVDAICRRPEWLNAFKHVTSRPRVAAVGRATAERLTGAGITVDLTPAAPDGGTALVAALVTRGSINGAHVLWPRSEIAEPELAIALRKHGAVVVDPPAYNTVPAVPAALPQFLLGLDAGQIGATAFLSPSSARGLAAALDGTLQTLRGRTLVASVGPTTSQAIMALGASVDIEALERRGDALAAAIADRLSARQGDAA